MSIFELVEVVFTGKLVAASASSYFDHSVGEGEFILEFASMLPEQDPLEVPAWCAFMWYPDKEDDPSSMLGSGYANTNRWPLVIQGPIPFKGPGHFRAVSVNANANDYIRGIFSYRKVKNK